MNRNFYSIGIFFTGLVFLTGLIQSIIFFRIGSQIYSLPSFIPWFGILTTITVLWSIIMLKYYHFRQYWFTFTAALLFTIALLFHSYVFYRLLTAGEWENYLIPSYIFTLGSAILYAISLIFFDAGKRPWLKMAGVAVFFFYLFLLSIIIWGMNSPDIQAKIALENYQQWAALVGNILPLFFIMNFWKEIKESAGNNELSGQTKIFNRGMALAGTIALLVMIPFASMIAHETSSSLFWGKRNFEKTQALVQLFESRSFVSNKGDTLHYQLLKPLDYDPEKKYPLLVTLPYGGQPGTDYVRQIEGAEAAHLLSDNYNRKRYPAFLFIPHCPPGKGWGGIPDYPTVDTLVFDAISALDKEYAIDEKRRYVTGISRGGYGSWHFISTRPDMFAAAIPVCGAGEPQLAPNIVDVSVWAFHGRNDKNVPVSGSRDMIEAIKNAGGNPRYTEFPEEAHNIWYQVTQTPDLFDWLFAQERE